MSKKVNFKRVVSGTMDATIENVTGALKAAGFGVLTRIDMHEKIKEKTGKEMSPVVILGSCNPNFAYEVYQLNTDVASLLPCNVVIREVAPSKMSVEIVIPSAMMMILDDPKLSDVAGRADDILKHVLQTL